MRRFGFMLLGLAILAGGRPLDAQGIIDVEISPVDRTGNPVVRLSSVVHTTINGRIATIEIEEQFRNDGGTMAEGSYLYPMPRGAVFTDFSLWMGEDEVRGEMMTADQARTIYENIVRKLKDPALLTLEGQGLIRARVFPIQPGETRKVVLRYTQVLPRAGDALRLSYSIGPRERNGRSRGDGAGFADAFSYWVTLPNADNIGTPYSPTHPITTNTRGDALEITLDAGATGDVEVFIPLRSGLIGTTLITHAPGGQDGFFMLLLAPPVGTEGTTVPRDLSLVVDVSGSMSGEKLHQAQAALDQALGTLGEQDRFRIIAFSSTVRHFREGYTPATRENLLEARRFVQNLRANGGTNIEGALNAVTDVPETDERLSLFVFLTDGLPSVGEQQPEQLAELAAARRGDARIFTFGIGHDVNTYLLDRLAVEGRGSADYVASGASVEHAVSNLLGKIEHPALMNLRIVSSPVDLIQTYPIDMPDLFFGEELVLFGRYDGRGSGEVVIEGVSAGVPVRFTATADFPATAHDNEFIPQLWAARRIGQLTRTIRLEGPSEQLIEEIRDLGLAYGIITEYTSYLVLEPGMETGEPVPVDQIMRRNEAAGAFAPAALQTGRAGFDDAKASADMAAVGSVAEAEEAVRERTMALAKRADKDAGRRQSTPPKIEDGRLFVERDGIWTDATHRHTAEVLEVVAFSDAYFALIRAIPELTPYLTVGSDMIVAGKDISIRIGADGETTLSPGKISDTARRFRGL